MEAPKQQTETQENNDHDHTVDMFFSDMPELDFNLFGGVEMADDSIDPLDTAYHVEGMSSGWHIVKPADTRFVYMIAL